MEYCENGNLKKFIQNYKDKNKLIEEKKNNRYNRTNMFRFNGNT